MFPLRLRRHGDLSWSHRSRSQIIIWRKQVQMFLQNRPVLRSWSRGQRSLSNWLQEVEQLQWGGSSWFSQNRVIMANNAERFHLEEEEEEDEEEEEEVQALRHGSVSWQQEELLSFLLLFLSLSLSAHSPGWWECVSADRVGSGRTAWRAAAWRGGSQSAGPGGSRVGWFWLVLIGSKWFWLDLVVGFTDGTFGCAASRVKGQVNDWLQRNCS